MTERTPPGARVRVFHGDSREVLRGFPDNHFDSVVTDPPYALVSIQQRFGSPDAAPAQYGRDGAFARQTRGFMGKAWDTGETAFDPSFWAEVLRVLKPGGHVAAFGGSQTYGELQVAIGLAGFEVRDSILEVVASDTALEGFLGSLSNEQVRALAKAAEDAQFGGLLGWLYGSGFPKSHNVAKALDRRAGATREVVGQRHVGKDMRGGNLVGKKPQLVQDMTRAASPEAREWEGWGTALKPAFEPIVLARKPLSEGSVAENVVAHRTGALNVEACRVAFADEADKAETVTKNRHALFGSGPRAQGDAFGADTRDREDYNAEGRYPANVILDESAEVAAAFPSTRPARAGKPRAGASGQGWGMTATGREYDDTGGTAARFFYSAKADDEDRVSKCPVCTARWIGRRPCACRDPGNPLELATAPGHPTVKPVDLKAYVARLITAPGGTVLDCFAGSGTTGMACLREGLNAVLIEREAEYVDDILYRLSHVAGGGTPLFGDLS